MVFLSWCNYRLTNVRLDITNINYFLVGVCSSGDLAWSSSDVQPPPAPTPHRAGGRPEMDGPSPSHGSLADSAMSPLVNARQCMPRISLNFQGEFTVFSIETVAQSLFLFVVLKCVKEVLLFIEKRA